MRTSYINIKDVHTSNLRTDASFHLSEGQEVQRFIANSPYPLLPISKVAKDIFIGNRAKRVYVKKASHGIPFLSSSDILRADLNNLKLASTKYTPDIERMKLQKGWTLISRSGTIGNCAFANAKHAQKLASEHVIRLCPNNILRGGLVYAYLASKYGHSLLTQGTFGAVIQHIEPAFVGSILIPSFPESFQKEVDDLIQESARLREEAAEALEEAHSFIESNFIFANKKLISSVSIKSVLLSHNKRFEATYHTSENRSIYEYIISNCKYIRLGDLCDRIFRPGIFKREYVSKGVTFLGGADILMAIPDSDKRLSFRQVEKMPELKVKKNWILVTCGGTIGNTVIIDKQLEQCVISQHVMRIVPKEDILKGYLFAVLSSKIGNNLISLFTTGSVIPQIEAHHLELVPIPLFNKDIMERIDNKVSSYISKIEVAKENERKAIRMVEEEIEKWNK